MDTVAQLRAFPHSKKLRKSGRQRASFLNRSSRVEEVAFCPPCSLGSSNKCTLVPALCRGLVLSLMYKEGSSFQKFCLPTRKQLWVELMLATECCRTLCSTEQIEHHLRFELRCKSSSLYHSNPLSWAYYTSWLSLRQVSNPWGALQSSDESRWASSRSISRQPLVVTKTLLGVRSCKTRPSI